MAAGNGGAADDTSYPAGATADSWTYEALNSLDAFPAELAEAARATLAESGK